MRRWFALLPLLLLLTLSTACEVSTANLSEIKMCDNVEDYSCPEDKTVFATDTPEFYVTASLNNAPEGTKVTIDWRYLEDQPPVDIDSVTVESQESTSALRSSLSKPSRGWPTGRYEVVLKIQTENAEAMHKEFSVR